MRRMFVWVITLIFLVGQPCFGLAPSSKFSRASKVALAQAIAEYHQKENLLSQEPSILDILKVRLATEIFRESRLPEGDWWSFMNATGLHGQPAHVGSTVLLMREIFTAGDVGDCLLLAKEISGKTYTELSISQRKRIANLVFSVSGLDAGEGALLRHFALGSPWGDRAYFVFPRWARRAEWKSFFANDLMQEGATRETAWELSEPGYLDSYKDDFEAMPLEDWNDGRIRANLVARILEDHRWVMGIKKEMKLQEHLPLESLRLACRVKAPSELLSAPILRAREAAEDMRALLHDITHKMIGPLSMLSPLNMDPDGEASLHIPVSVSSFFKFLSLYNKNNPGMVHDQNEAKDAMDTMASRRDKLVTLLRKIKEDGAGWHALIEEIGRLKPDDAFTLELLANFLPRVDDALRMLSEYPNYQKAATPGKFVHVNLQDVIDDSRIRQWGKGYLLSADHVSGIVYPNTPDVAISSVASLKQVLEQCIHNAGQAMHKGSDAAKPGNLKVLAQAYYRDPRWVQIIIEDSGHGIPRIARSHIFEPNYTHGKEGGTGVGLDVVREWIRENRGSIWVESREGKGAKFVILLPTEEEMRKDLLIAPQSAVLLRQPIGENLGAVLPGVQTSFRSVLYGSSIESLSLPSGLLLNKIVVGTDAKGLSMDIRHGMMDNLGALAKKLSETRAKKQTMKIGDLRGAILFRPRHRELLREILRAGVVALHVDGIRSVDADDDADFNAFWKDLALEIDKGSNVTCGNMFFLKHSDTEVLPGLYTGELDFVMGAADDVGHDVLSARITEILGGQMSSCLMSRKNSEFSLERNFSPEELQAAALEGFYAPDTLEQGLGRNQHRLDDVYSSIDLARSPDSLLIITAREDNPWVKDLKGISVDPWTGDKTIRSLIAARGVPVRIVESVYRGNYVQTRKAMQSERDGVARMKLAQAFAEHMRMDGLANEALSVLGDAMQYFLSRHDEQWKANEKMGSSL